MIRQTFDIRSCHYDLPGESPDRPCLDYFIERCKAPCVGKQTEEDYREMIDRILEILSGHTGKLKREVGEAMEEASERLDFERAAELRDVLRGLASLERRKTAIDARGGNRDVLGIARSGKRASALFLRVREGKLLGRDVHYLEIGEAEEEEEGAEEAGLPALTARVLASAYLGRDDLPPELLVPADFEDRELIEAMLAESREGAFRIRVPRRGTGRRLLELAEENAAHLLVERAELARGEEREAGTRVASMELARALGLDTPPKDIVCFDISTLGGTDSVGAAVWLRDGRPWKKEYRRFRIRLTEEGQLDDFSMMQEVVGRYFARRVEKGEDMPDLVLIDGGKGQLGAARHAMERSGVSDLPVAALAKRLEEVFLPGKRDPVSLDPRSAGLRWLKRARDEAHRFSVDYHRKLRRKRTLRSVLADVPGVGPRREQDLLRRFGSARAIREAAPEDLMAVRGIGRATARRILDSLQESEP
jgi:excinuclease ABC subunit C